jgi:hypothetical protein
MLLEMDMPVISSLPPLGSKPAIGKNIPFAGFAICAFTNGDWHRR